MPLVAGCFQDSQCFAKLLAVSDCSGFFVRNLRTGESSIRWTGPGCVVEGHGVQSIGTHAVNKPTKAAHEPGVSFGLVSVAMI